MAEYAVLMEKEGRVHVLEISDEMAKYKGLGVLNTATLLSDVTVGEVVLFGIY